MRRWRTLTDVSRSRCTGWPRRRLHILMYWSLCRKRSLFASPQGVDLCIGNLDRLRALALPLLLGRSKLTRDKARQVGRSWGDGPGSICVSKRFCQLGSCTLACRRKAAKTRFCPRLTVPITTHIDDRRASQDELRYVHIGELASVHDCTIRYLCVVCRLMPSPQVRAERHIHPGSAKALDSWATDSKACSSGLRSRGIEC